MEEPTKGIGGAIWDFTKIIALASLTAGLTYIVIKGMSGFPGEKRRATGSYDRVPGVLPPTRS
jgi:hypothetical protein